MLPCAARIRKVNVRTLLGREADETLERFIRFPSQDSLP